MKNILLVCGTGASSGFMARNLSKAAKTQGYDFTIRARSQSELEDYIEEVDLVLVGPHFKHMFAGIKKVCEEYDVPTEIIDEDAYGELDGEAVLAAVLKYV